jgi:protein TonB
VSAPARSARIEHEIQQAERFVLADLAERPRIRRAVLIALLVHAAVLWGRLPHLGPSPLRVDAPAELMQVQFLQPPQPPASTPKPSEPERKSIARPDPTLDEPETEVAAPEAEPAPVSGPVRMASGQGPGVIKRVEPIYPPIARTARIDGTVVLDAVIMADGSVGEITVLESANPILERSAIDALKQWRFTPGHQDVIMTLTVNFVLK